MDKDICQLCTRKELLLTKHHLVPKEEGGTHSEIALLCIPCHRTIHSFYSNKELALHLNTLDLLKDDPKINKYLRWIKKQPLKSKIRIRSPHHRNKRRH
ncbi:HNH endonuclease [Haloplasma contractile]|uniref:Nuclease component protein n=1 Tax=Haloplasma contractile SSD-17B TaxID=1033810 RepID=U2EDQ2_9MOLU|nr:HNH endonuclease [Haloplasma contractile]ERJ13113.1 putative nuclease component protein [Haloplasma contractile SSD-17B]